MPGPPPRESGGPEEGPPLSALSFRSAELSTAVTPDGPADERARESADGEADQDKDQDRLNYLSEPHSRAERLDHGDRTQKPRAGEGSAQRVSDYVVVLAAHGSCPNRS